MNVIALNILAISASMTDSECPTDERSYDTRKREFNCTSNMTYHCGLIVNGSFSEFCMEEKAFLAEECPIFRPSQEDELEGDKSYECPYNCSGCPNTTYLSSELYKYPTCFSVRVQLVNVSLVNKEQVSVECPEDGTSQSPSALASTAGISVDVYTVQCKNLSSNSTVRTEDNYSNSDLFVAVTVTSMVVWLILISFCCYKKTRSANKTDADVPLELSTRSSLHHRDLHNPNCSSTICYSQTLSQNNSNRPSHPESAYDEYTNQQDTTHQQIKSASATLRQNSFVISKGDSTPENYYDSSSHHENKKQENSSYTNKFEIIHHDISPHIRKSETVYDEVDKCDTVVISDSTTASLVVCDEDDTYFHLEPRRNLPV